MTVYSFACSIPDNWYDWHFLVKTFSAPIITGSITGIMATLAYIVARTQREIAANKYNLDLFDKRYPVYEEFVEAFKNNIKNCDYNISEFIFDLKHETNRSLISKCSRLFFDIEKDCKLLLIFIDIRNTLINNGYQKSMEERIELLDLLNISIENIKVFLEKPEAKNIPKEFIKEKYDNIEKLEKFKSDYGNYFNNILFRNSIQKNIDVMNEIVRKMENQLTLSHYPYEEKDKIYVFGWIITAYNFFRKLTFKRSE